VVAALYIKHTVLSEGILLLASKEGAWFGRGLRGIDGGVGVARPGDMSINPPFHALEIYLTSWLVFGLVEIGIGGGRPRFVLLY
jgi:hypothetical protein